MREARLIVRLFRLGEARAEGVVAILVLAALALAGIALWAQPWAKRHRLGPSGPTHPTAQRSSNFFLITSAARARRSLPRWRTICA